MPRKVPRHGLGFAATALVSAAQTALAEQWEMPADCGLQAERSDGLLADVRDGFLDRVSHKDEIEIGGADEHGNGPSIAGDDDAVVSIGDSVDHLGELGLDFGEWQRLRHDQYSSQIGCCGRSVHRCSVHEGRDTVAAMDPAVPSDLSCNLDDTILPL